MKYFEDFILILILIAVLFNFAFLYKINNSINSPKYYDDSETIQYSQSFKDTLNKE